MTTFRDLPEDKQAPIREAFAIAGARSTLYEKSLLAFLAARLPMAEAEALAVAYVANVTEYTRRQHDRPRAMLDEALAASAVSLKLTATPEAPYATPS